MATDKESGNRRFLPSLNGDEGGAATTSPCEQDRKEADHAEIADTIGSTNGFSMDWKNITTRKVLESYLKSKNDDAWKDDAWTEFKKRVQPCIRGTSAGRLRKSHCDAPPELLDDLEQDTHRKLLANDCENLRKFTWNHDDAIYSYVKVTACRVTLDWIRKNNNEPGPLSETYDPPAPSSGIDMEILRKQIDDCLFTLAHEPEFKRDRAIFWMYFRYGYRARQIAKAVKLPVKTVENILLRLRKKVVSLLGADSKGPKPGGHNGR